MIRAWLLLWQSVQPTVGDTVWIERLLGDVGRAVVRPQQWDLGAEGTQLGPAIVGHGATGASVRYPVVLWYPGERSLTMPGPVLIYPDGTSDTLPASTHRVRLSSVLPAGEPRSRIPPKPPRNPLELGTRSLIPLVVLLGGTGILIGIVAFRWRRKGKPVPRPEPVLREPGADLLDHWVSLGEYRAALHHYGWRLSRRLRASQDLAEMAELQHTLEEIGDRTFEPGEPEELAALAARASDQDRG